MNDNNKEPLERQRRMLIRVGAILGILLAALSGVIACELFAGTDPAEPQVAAPVSTEATVPATSLPGFTVPEVTVSEIDFGTGPQIDEGIGNIVNILLIGVDSDAPKGARSDCIIVCTFNREDNTITMTSFLRDLYVRIPGYGKDRINAAYSLGGSELLIKTLSTNFDVEIDGSICVDFSHFRKIIDLLGGVTMELSAAEAKFINKHVSGSELTEGEHLLTGKQALIYARNRNDADGDFARTNRQRKLLIALIDAIKSKKMTQMLSLAGELLPLINTDLSKTDLTRYAVKLAPMLSNAQISTQHIPISGGYYHANIDEKSVLVPYMEKNLKVLEDTWK